MRELRKRDIITTSITRSRNIRGIMGGGGLRAGEQGSGMNILQRGQTRAYAKSSCTLKTRQRSFTRILSQLKRAKAYKKFITEVC